LLAAVNRYQNVAGSEEQMFKTIKLDPYYSVVFANRTWKGLSRRYFQMRKENRVVLIVQQAVAGVNAVSVFSCSKF
jgi:hypothetical protein